jgi:hypothetical protein
VSALLDSALGYARRGIPVFPLHSPLEAGGCSCRRDTCARPALQSVDGPQVTLPPRVERAGRVARDQVQENGRAGLRERVLARINDNQEEEHRGDG